MDLEQIHANMLHESGSDFHDYDSFAEDYAQGAAKLQQQQREDCSSTPIPFAADDIKNKRQHFGSKRKEGSNRFIAQPYPER